MTANFDVKMISAGGWMIGSAQYMDAIAPCCRRSYLYIIITFAMVRDTRLIGATSNTFFQLLLEADSLFEIGC
jgi:hypothetical protein